MSNCLDWRPDRLVVLNRRHPLTYGLEMCWVATPWSTSGPRELVHGGYGIVTDFMGDKLAVNRNGRVLTSLGLADNSKRITFAAPTVAAGLSRITVAAITRLTDTARTSRRIVGLRSGSTNRWWLGCSPTSGKWGFLVYTISDGEVNTSSEFNLNNHCVVGTYDGLTMSIYVDGIRRDGSNHSDPGAISSSTNPVALFNTYDGTWNNYPGEVSGVFVWNRALCPKCVAQFSARPWDLLRAPYMPQGKSPTLTTQQANWFIVH